MTNDKFTSHDKRVTLNLALNSACCQENQPLMAALKKLPETDWDVYKLTQPEIEVLYAEFDDELEAKIKSEFQADPGFLIDVGHSDADCPLCGHQHIRWLFNIQNVAGGTDVRCGSSCIITHGLSVKGSETAEHAKAALEAAIRKQIKKLKIEAWHKAANFDVQHIIEVIAGLKRLSKNYVNDYKIRNSAFYKISDTRKLDKFYARTGWLNTPKRWAEWSRLAKFARQFDDEVKLNVPFPVSFEVTSGKSHVATTTLSPEAEKAVAAVKEQPAPVAKVTVAPVVESKKVHVPQMDMPFNEICKDLLTASLGQ